MDAIPISETPDAPPRLLAVIDTEEEFDWGGGFSRAHTGVSAMQSVGRFQEIFDRHGIVPTYVIDYPVASKEEGFRDLKAFADDGRALIGTHLHPWVSPPYDEEVGPFNSYPGNLPPELERQKLTALTEIIEANLGARPTIYKAGRYGIGAHTPGILSDLGYRVDLSFCPGFDYRSDGGPDFTRFSNAPQRMGENGAILALPRTGGFTGFLKGLAPTLYPLAASPLGVGFRLPGILSRLGALDRIGLSPEGYQLADLKKLTRSLLGEGVRTFSFCLHSPSAAPGFTPFVRDREELSRFLQRMDDYFSFFLGELGGAVSTPLELHRQFIAETP